MTEDTRAALREANQKFTPPLTLAGVLVMVVTMLSGGSPASDDVRQAVEECRASAEASRAAVDSEAFRRTTEVLEELRDVTRELVHVTRETRERVDRLQTRP